MKRGLSAFPEQTIEFMLSEGNESAQAMRLVHRKFEAYKAELERKNVKY